MSFRLPFLQWRVPGNASAQRSFLLVLPGPPHSCIDSQAWHIFLWASFAAHRSLSLPSLLFNLLVCLLRECMLSKDKGFVSPKTEPDSWQCSLNVYGENGPASDCQSEVLSLSHFSHSWLHEECYHCLCLHLSFLWVSLRNWSSSDLFVQNQL